jgi:hypothetical protein
VYEPIKSVERNNSQSRKEKVGNPHWHLAVLTAFFNNC